MSRVKPFRIRQIRKLNLQGCAFWGGSDERMWLRFKMWQASRFSLLRSLSWVMINFGRGFLFLTRQNCLHSLVMRVHCTCFPPRLASLAWPLASCRAIAVAASWSGPWTINWPSCKHLYDKKYEIFFLIWGNYALLS